VSVLNELLGTEMEVGDLPVGKDFQDHVERARIIGDKLHKVLIQEFAPEGTLSPEQGEAGARRFTGFVVNFAVSTALLAIISEIESFGKLHEIRELGVEVAQNLALGRLHRQALMPLIHTTIATPYQAALNERYRPTGFKENEIVKLVQAGVVPEADARRDLARLGFSDERITQLFALHTARISGADLERLLRWGVITEAHAIEQLTLQGFSEEIAKEILAGEELKRLDSLQREFVAVLEKQFIDGFIDHDQLVAALDGMALTGRERHAILVIAANKKEAPRKSLTVAQLTQSFEEAVIDLQELDEELHREGYSDDDRAILRILILLKTAKIEDAKKHAVERKNAKLKSSKKKKP
jgi:hypothetical protein